MRIGINTLVASPLRPGSILEYTQRLVESLARVDQQHEWFLFVSQANHVMFKDVSNPHFHRIFCPASNERMPLRILSEQTYLPFYALRYRLDVLYCLGDVCPIIPTCCYVIKLNTFHHHQIPASLSPLRRVYRRLMNDRSAHAARLLIANSTNARDDALKFTGVSPSKVSVIDEAVDEAFQPATDRQAVQAALATEFGLTRPYILFVSLLYRHKNMWRLLEAFAQARQHMNSNQLLIFAGSDPEKRQPELEALARKLGVHEHVRFLGRVAFPDLVRLYQATDLFVYPSLSETFGKPPLEAMACGAPVVASAVGSIPEVVGEAALLINPEDVNDLAAKIVRGLTDAGLRQALIAKGYARVKRYGWQRVATETIAALELAVTRHRSK